MRDTDRYPTVFAENAGGSQVLASVAEAISSYLVSTNVQMAKYPLAQRAEERVAMGTNAAAVLLGAQTSREVLIGQSATQLTFSLSLMLERRVLADRAAGVADTWQQGDEIIVADADHETNRGAWTNLAQRLGLVVKPWPVTRIPGAQNPYAVTLDPQVLAGIVTPRTRLVAFTACSNLLGAFTDIPAAVQVVRAQAPSALICVDCVAFAPHRRLEPAAWGVDVAFFSLYKTFGAHVGAMYVSPAVTQTRLAPLNHFFLQGKPDAGMYPYQSSSVQYELNYSIAPVADYFASLAHDEVRAIDYNHAMGRPDTRAGEQGAKLTRAQLDTALDRAFTAIAQHEQLLLDIFIPYLRSKYDAGVRIVGPESASSAVRAPTVSFCVVDPATGAPVPGASAKIHTLLVASGEVGAQQGHMYAHALISTLGLDLVDGVVRLSFVHYNTPAEARRCTALLDAALAQL